MSDSFERLVIGGIVMRVKEGRRRSVIANSRESSSPAGSPP